MEYEFRDGKLLVSRTAEERAPIVQRLRRIEGQVRGIATETAATMAAKLSGSPVSAAEAEAAAARTVPA